MFLLLSQLQRLTYFLTAAALLRDLEHQQKNRNHWAPRAVQRDECVSQLTDDLQTFIIKPQSRPYQQQSWTYLQRWRIFTPPPYLLSPKSPNCTVERIGNKAERIRQQWSLLPVLATVDFQQSRPCWIQRCRQCVAGLRLTKVTVLMQCYCHCWTEVKLLCCVVLCRKCCVKHCKDCCATVEGRCGDVAMSTINRTLARTPRTLTYVYIYIYVYINIKYRYIGLMICNDVISDVTHTHTCHRVLVVLREPIYRQFYNRHAGRQTAWTDELVVFHCDTRRCRLYSL